MSAKQLVTALVDKKIESLDVDQKRKDFINFLVSIGMTVRKVENHDSFLLPAKSLDLCITIFVYECSVRYDVTYNYNGGEREDLTHWYYFADITSEELCDTIYDCIATAINLSTMH